MNMSLVRSYLASQMKGGEEAAVFFFFFFSEACGSAEVESYCVMKADQLGVR